MRRIPDRRGLPLGTTTYNPGTMASYTVAVGAAADVDATNLAVAFTVPPSGRVTVKLQATLQNNSGGNIHWALRSGAADVAGTDVYMTQDALAGIRLSYEVLVTGLTPGASLTYKWAAFANGAAGSIFAGGSIGPAFMQVVAA